MNMLARLTIPTKILLVVLMLAAVTAGIAFAGSRALLHTNDSYAGLVGQSKAPLFLARANRRATEMAYDAYRTVVYDGGSQEARGAAVASERAYAAGKDLFAKAIAARPEAETAVADFERRFDRLHDLTQQADQLGLANKNAAATAILGKADALADALGKDMSAANDAIIKSNADASDALTAASRSTSTLSLVLSLAGVVVSIGVSLVVARFGITGPLVRLKAAMAALAAGDHHVVVDGDRRDEVGDMARVVLVFRETALAKAAADTAKVDADRTVQMVVETLGASLAELSARDLTTRVAAAYPGPYAVLKDNYNDAVESVRTTIEQVSDSARTISTGADEIAQASEDLARRTESNAASLEQTSAALTQIEGRLRATATASHSTVARADQAMATVDTGRATAETAMQAMGRVSGSAKGIDDVIEGLDKIAFQTRVLAMNAAVEAGRAGDAGRGFAVVADLVSALAMRAEEEAKRARDQLSITQSEIVTAVDAVAKVDTALAAISGDVTEVNHLLAGMAADNQAQSSAISEITAAVSTMDRATQQNAAMVEQTSAAARSLTQEVGTLAGAAAQFTVDGGVRPADGGARAAVGRSAAPRPAAPAIRTAPPRRPVKARPMPGTVAGGLANGHANGHASHAAENDWADF